MAVLAIGLIAFSACGDDDTSGSKLGGKKDASTSAGGGKKDGSSSKDDGGSNATGDGGGALADGGSGSTATPEACDVVVKESDCDKTQRPFVFVHGTYGSGDNFAHVAALLGSNGFCQDRIVAVEYNSLGESPGSDGQIDDVINKVLADNPDFDQVDIAAHSQGTGHCGTYLGVAANAKKVAHYINFSGIPSVGDVDTLSLSSMHDLGGSPHHATGNKVKAVTFKDQDHFAVAASTDSFVEVYKYLTGKDPKYKTVQCGEEQVAIEGVSETFADNMPVAGKVEVREVGAVRANGKPVATAMSDADGHFGPIMLKRGVPYEFKGFDADGKLVGYQYFTPFKRSNRLVRMLSPASANDGSPVGGLVAMQSTDHVVRDANHVAIVARWLGGAFRQDLGASMMVNGKEVLTDGNAGLGALATASLGGGVVGFFMYDDNKNSKTDLGLPYSTSFIAFTDVFMDATKPALVKLSFTAGSEEATSVDVPLEVSNWPSSDALISVMFQ